MDIENLEINVKTNAGNASKELGSLSDALERLKGAVKGSFNSKGLNNLASSIVDLTNAAQGAGETANVLNAIANALKALSGVGKVSIPSNIGTAITNLATATASIDPDVTQRLNDFASVLINLSNVGQISIPSSLAKQIEAIGAAAATITPEALNAIKRLGDVLSRVGNIDFISDFGESVSGMISQINILDAAVQRMGGHLSDIGSTSFSIRQVGTAAKKAAGHAGGLLNSLKRIALYRILRTVLKEIGQAFTEGLKAAYNYSAKMTGEVHRFASSLDSLTSASNQMKGQLGSAFAGLLTAIAPVLEQIINAVTSAFNAISQLLAAFTGGTYMKAVRVQTSYGDAASSTASSLNDAADAQKELNKQLMSFDEINKLDEPKSSSGSGGTGGNGGAGNGAADAIQFVTASVPDIIKDAIANADFTQLGNIVGQKIKDALDRINWTEIKASAQRIATSIATFLNGFLETEGLSTSVGTTIAGAINTGFEFANTLLESFHFDSLGSFISSGLQSAVRNTDLGEVSRLLSNIGISIFDLIRGGLEGTDWKALPKDIANNIVESLKGFKFKDFFESSGELVGAAVVASINLEKGIEDLLGDFLGSIADYFKNHIDKAKESGVSVAGGILNGIFQGFINIEAWIFDNISKPILSGILKGLVGEENYEPIVNGLKTAFVNLPTYVEDIINRIKEYIKGLKIDLNPFDGNGVGITETISLKAAITGEITKTTDKTNGTGVVDGVTGNASKLVDKTMGTGVVSNVTGQAAKLVDKTNGTGVINNVTANAPSVKVANKTVDKMTANAPKVTVANKTVDGMTAKAPSVNVANKTVDGMTARAEAIKWMKKGADKSLGSVKAIASKITPAKGKGVIDGIKATVSNITLTGKAKSVWDKLMGKAKGGVYQNGRWSNIPQYAGGTLNAGSMFIAGEAGPEIVGHVGGRTEVLNASQIASAIYTAVVSAMDNSSNNQPVNVNVYLDGRVVAENSLGHYRNMVRAGGDPLAGIV